MKFTEIEGRKNTQKEKYGKLIEWKCCYFSISQTY